MGNSKSRIPLICMFIYTWQRPFALHNLRLWVVWVWDLRCYSKLLHFEPKGPVFAEDELKGPGGFPLYRVLLIL